MVGTVCMTDQYFVCVSGLFFIVPCIDSYTKVDLRTVSFDVPPQEVSGIGISVIDCGVAAKKVFTTDISI